MIRRDCDELMFLWVENYKNLNNKLINLSTYHSAKKNGNKIDIHSNKHIPIGFYPNGIDIIEIIGKNGSGKSSVLESIVGVSNFKDNPSFHGSYLIYRGNEKSYYVIGDVVNVPQVFVDGKEVQVRRSQCPFSLVYYSAIIHPFSGIENLRCDSNIFKNVSSNKLGVSSSFQKDILNQFRFFNSFQELNDSSFKIPRFFELDIEKPNFRHFTSFLGRISRNKERDRIIDLFYSTPYSKDKEIEKIQRRIIEGIVNLMDSSVQDEYEEKFLFSQIVDVNKLIISQSDIPLYIQIFSLLRLNVLFNEISKRKTSVIAAVSQFISFITDYNFFEELILANNELFESKAIADELIRFHDIQIAIEDFVKDLQASIGHGSNNSRLPLLFNPSEFERFNIVFSKVKSNKRFGRFIKLQWSGVSTGELARLNLFSRIYAAASELEIKTGEKIILILDEPDAFLHPDWQRELVESIFKIVPKILDSANVHIVLTSHSPLILSDVCTESVVFLDQKNKLETEYERTFASNIHELYWNDFMSSTIGEFAQNKINKLIECLTDSPELVDDSILKTIELVGDEVIRQALLDMYTLKSKDPFLKRKILQDQIEKLKLELDEIT